MDRGQGLGQLHRLTLDELGARGELDWSRCAIDSVSVRALIAHRGQLAGPNPTDRGIKGSKIHLIVDRRGPPLAVGISAANLHDNQALIPLVRGIPPIRSRRGPQRRRPGKLNGDTGYAATCGNGSPPAASSTVSPARVSSRPNTWGATAGSWNEPCPGCPAAAASTAATSASRNTASPSLPSPRPSYAIAGLPSEMASRSQVAALINHTAAGQRTGPSLLRLLTPVDEYSAYQRPTAEASASFSRVRSRSRRFTRWARTRG
ncbi:transposase DDE domain protein [Streptomyces collinus Tu 365]|uniref:Transposase DDE domain protein n=1 Tax=Streptomyces collinus (strain DSM 40733 / Tue 365) TaxID=1214242 RepID=S5VNI6_STRC3|nr:transposase DDE domain protein [Streptomyces collinus Tu 365]